MVYSLFNMRINELFSRTMTNGTEAVLAIVAFYYYSKLVTSNKGYKVFDFNMGVMTWAITMAFIVRSSSLLGWIPLALATIFSGKNFYCILMNFRNILLSGIFVAVPIMVFSILFDSLIYGKFTCPQWQFVYVNVILNISSEFGISEYTYYIE